MDVALEGLLRGAASHVDPIVRRMCIQTLRRLLADIAAASQPPPGFQQCALALCMACKHVLHIVSMYLDKHKLLSSLLSRGAKFLDMKATPCCCNSRQWSEYVALCVVRLCSSL